MDLIEGIETRRSIRAFKDTPIQEETLNKIFNNEFSIVVYNDAMLYQKNAPINKIYQRWIVEWLTEKWHSRFEINQNTWELFKTKATAIFNESLLTAKFRELGYPPENYGNKIYY